MRAFHFAVLAAGLLAAPLSAVPAAAAETAPPKPRADQPARMILVNTPLRQALQRLFRARPGDCLVAVDVPDVRVRAQLSYTTLSEAVDTLIKAARAADPELALSVANGRYLIFHTSAFQQEAVLSGSPPMSSALLEPSGHGEEELVSADFRDMPLRDVLRVAFTGSGLQYVVDPNVQNVPITFSIRDIRLAAMLRLIVRQAAVSMPGLEIGKQDDIYVVSIRPGSAPTAARTPAPPPAERLNTLDLRDTPLREALALLFRGSGLQYSVDPNVPSVPITLNIRDISVPAALRLIIRQAAVSVPGLTTAREGDIYLIRMRPAPAFSE